MSFKLGSLIEIFSSINKPKTLVVIEIGNDWLKVVKGSILSGDIQIDESSFIKLSQIKDSVLDTLSRIFKEKNLDKKNVIISLPRHFVTTRIMDVPSVNLQEINNIIHLHIGKHTPYSKEEIVYSYRVIESQKEGYTKIMLVIARRTLINERLDVLLNMSIEPKKISFSSEGAYLWFMSLNSEKLSKVSDSEVVVLIDIDSNYSDFLVIHKGSLRFSKNMLIGSNHLDQEQKIDFNKFINEILHSIKIFNEEAKNIKISKIYFSGAAWNINDLDIIMSAQLGVACETMDVLKGVKTKGDIQELRNEIKHISMSPIWGILRSKDGLAFDLMSNEKRIEKMMERKRENLTMTGGLFIAIVMMFSILIVVYITNKISYTQQVKSKIISIKSDSDQIDQMRSFLNVIHDRLDARGDVLNIIKEVYRLVPREVYLTTIDIERRGQITIKGHAVAISDVFKFVTSLESSPFFERVKNNYASTKEKDNGQYADFEIVAYYKYLNVH